MRNLKKILALVLALVMSFSLMATANAFKDDKDIDATYDEAVEVLNALGVFQGYEDGSFQPKGEITRAEVAAIIYRIVTGDVADKQVGIYADYNKFTDVKSTSWYAGYVNFCANAEYIKGYGDGKFGPNDKVTGYQALAMILRAVGYDKNGEFTGANWQVQTAAVGKKLGITDTVSAGTLGTAATREVVAEILFRAIQVPQVEYTVAFGYQSYGLNSIGWDTFKLAEVGEVNIDYGRPAKQWNAYGRYLIALPYEPVVSYDKPVDECDVAKDMGLTRSATVSQAWLDGENITKITTLTGSNNTIDPLYVTKGANIIGDQGRQTEIYQLANGTYSIVEINTFFGVVSKVVPSTADKNGHATKAYIVVDVYESVQPTQYVVYTDGFAKADTVLVTLDAGDVATIEAVEPTSTGRVTAYSQRQCNNDWTIKDIQAKVVGTVTLGSTTYTDADKFYVGYPTVASDVLYNVYFDNFGNVIALIPVGINATYGVINAIRWNSPSIGTTVGGYVTANLTLADGSVVTDVVVSKINGKTPWTADSLGGDPTKSSVSNAYYLNGEYYGHLITYVVNEDGNYELSVQGAKACAAENVKTVDMTNATITKGKSTIYGTLATSGEQINVAYASDETVFLYYNGNYGYDMYKGYNNAPTITGATICYLVSGGRVTLAVVNGKLTDTNVFQAYLASTSVAYVRVIGGALYNVYNVYKVGSTEVTQVTVAQSDAQPAAAGFYTVTVDNGIAKLAVDHVYPNNDGVKDATYCGHKFDITRALTAVVENSIATRTFGAPNKNFSNMVDATYFEVYNGQVTAADYTAVSAGDIITVFYDVTTVQVGSLQQKIYTPVYVYVYTGVAPGGDEDVDVPGAIVNTVKITYTAGTVTNAAGVVVASGSEQAAGSTYTFVVVAGTTAPTVSTDVGTLALVSSNTQAGTYTYTLTFPASSEAQTANIIVGSVEA